MINRIMMLLSVIVVVTGVQAYDWDKNFYESGIAFQYKKLQAKQRERAALVNDFEKHMMTLNDFREPFHLRYLAFSSPDYWQDFERPLKELAEIGPKRAILKNKIRALSEQLAMSQDPLEQQKLKRDLVISNDNFKWLGKEAWELNEVLNKTQKKHPTWFKAIPKSVSKKLWFETIPRAALVEKMDQEEVDPAELNIAENVQKKIQRDSWSSVRWSKVFGGFTAPFYNYWYGHK